MFTQRLKTAWPIFLSRRAERLRALGSKRQVAERAIEGILEDLLVMVLDWSLGEIVYQSKRADTALVYQGRTQMVLEIEPPQRLPWSSAFLQGAMHQGYRYAVSQQAHGLGVSDGNLLYIENLIAGRSHPRLLIKLDSPNPDETLWWLSRVVIQQQRNDVETDFNPLGLPIKQFESIGKAVASSSAQAEWLTLSNDLTRDGKRIISIGELKSNYGARAYAFASRLVSHGALSRLAQGVYAIKPFGSWDRPYSLSALGAASFVCHGQPYYCGGLRVLSLHGLTSQLYPGRVDVFVAQRRASRQVAGAQVVFHQINSNLFSFGIATVSIDDIPTQISSPERTLIDLLEHPEIAGGTSYALDSLVGSLGQVSASRLVDCAILLACPTNQRRLGYLLEANGCSSTITRPLLAARKGAAPGSALVPGISRHGTYNNRWRLVVNHDFLNRSALLTSGHLTAHPSAC